MMPQTKPGGFKLGPILRMPILKNPENSPHMLAQDGEVRILASFLENGEDTVERTQPLPSEVTATEGAIPFTAFRADTNRPGRRTEFKALAAAAEDATKHVLSKDTLAPISSKDDARPRNNRRHTLANC